MLMNLKTLQWDEKLLDFFDIPRVQQHTAINSVKTTLIHHLKVVFLFPQSVLPKICSSSEIFGVIRESHLAGRPVAGVRTCLLLR